MTLLRRLACALGLHAIGPRVLIRSLYCDRGEAARDGAGQYTGLRPVCLRCGREL